MPPRRSGRVTLVDVAQRARVDKAIVSRVVNQDPTLVIRDETRARVVAAVSELGYRTNAAARSLRTARSAMIGMLIPDFANPVYAEIIAGAEQAALAHGYVLVTGSAQDLRTTSDQYIEMLGAGRVDGLLLAGSRLGRGVQAQLLEQKLPWLMINRNPRPHGNRYIVLDDAAAARLAVSHLVNLGHLRLAHVAGPKDADTAARRAKGYRAQLRASGIDVDPELAVGADYTPAGGALAMAELLDRGVRPTAAFVANVASAIGVLDTLRRRHLRVPEDMSIVAVHDLPLAAYLAPALTTVRMPLHRLGEQAVELLLTRSVSESIEVTVGEDIELIVRESTAPPR